MIYDFVVIGSGIIGVSVAYNIKLKNPLAKIIILEKEPQSFMHQTSHNSGVIHSGIYYKPNSLKSEFCKIGLKKTYDYCTKYNIKFDKCGKIIAATNKKEQLDLYRLYQNGKESNLPIKLISKNKLRSIEPNLLAVEGIFSPETGIINWKLFANSLLENFLEMGGVISYSYRVNSIDEDDSSVLIIDDKNNKIRSSKVISCGGLQSDRLARLVGIKPNLKIIPFRGDYFKLSKKFNKLFNHLIYPVPDINLPFLGIHFTKTIEEFITIGPNASINFSREGYERFNVNFKDIIDYSSYGGFWKLLYKQRSFVIDEFLTSFFKSYYLKKCSKYFIGLKINDIENYNSGIRAQVVMEDGSLAHDFIFEHTAKTLFVINAPSPAATSSLPIGEYIANKILEL